MKKGNTAIVSLLIVVVVLGGGFFIYQQNQQAKMKVAEEKEAMVKEEGDREEASEQEAMEKKNAAMEKTDDTKMMDKNANPRYVSYSKAAYDAASGKRRVLYFYATWCPSCKQANEDFLANPNKIPKDVVVLRVNYNDPDTDQAEKDLAKKYGITYQHTFVQVDAQGKEITKWNGGQTDELLTNIK